MWYHTVAALPLSLLPSPSSDLTKAKDGRDPHIRRRRAVRTDGQTDGSAQSVPGNYFARNLLLRSDLMNPNTGGPKFEWQIIYTHRGLRTIFRSHVFGFIMLGTCNNI
ncbi:hypothetical protein B9Z19DRAFT_846205 [Tuber borchii]|uniref:Uncharacterized protein n=1 Tax=Tuber borchii TaxID=42251 RepID=A0A2T6ZUL5_TUBBO|nr:hypothetical protein B9Z19DRAFT_846205 [Tuber borchii]